MNTTPCSTSMANVNGSKMMMVLAALKPGIAPTISPSSMAGTMIHQNPSVWTNSPKNIWSETSSILQNTVHQGFERPFGKVGIEGDDEQQVPADR